MGDPLRGWGVFVFVVGIVGVVGFVWVGWVYFIDLSTCLIHNSRRVCTDFWGYRLFARERWRDSIYLFTNSGR
jgi:hypothetical protein